MVQANQDPSLVDTSPAQAPIQANTTSLDQILADHPAAASDAHTLAMTPNRYEDATTGPDPQISQTTYVTVTKPDGTSFLSPLSSVPYYEAKGYTSGAQQEIKNYVAWRAEQEGGPAVEEEPTQSPEDAMKRLAGIPKTQAELDADAAEQERLRSEKMQAAQPAPTTDADRASKPTPKPAPKPPAA